MTDTQIPSIYKLSAVSFPLPVPLPAEPHLATWEQYAALSEAEGVWGVLQSRLVQLQFPVQEGISQTAVYRTATRSGTATDNMAEATGLRLQQPDALNLCIYPSLAGAIPVLTTPGRADFVALVQAFTYKNEPIPVPDSMGACMVAGYNNWDRIRAHRQQWETKNPDHSEQTWRIYLTQVLMPQKHLYQDRFIILSNGRYSGVPAAEMELDEAKWRELSQQIRLEHECTHYFTKRVFGEMRVHVFDELLADYAGIVSAVGSYRADWFLRFMGLEAFPHYRPGGRLQNYLPGLSPEDEAFQATQAQLKTAAENLESFDRCYGASLRNPEERASILLAICSLGFENLASADGHMQLREQLEEIRRLQTSNQLSVTPLSTDN